MSGKPGIQPQSSLKKKKKKELNILAYTLLQKYFTEFNNPAKY